MVTPSTQLYAALVMIAATVAIMALVRNRIVRRRLSFSLSFLVIAVAAHVVFMDVPFFRDGAYRVQGLTLAGLVLAFAVINVLVTALFNPWMADKPGRATAIVQDALVLALFGIVAIVMFRESASALTGSAIAVAVLGFALQETLGNAFAGLALQLDKPFRVGHWITVGNYDGLVTHVTWRATKIRTKDGNNVIVPNNLMAREAITNYSEPVAPTRLFVEVGATYLAPPNHVRDAIYAAIAQVPRVLKAPAPDVLVQDFGSSAITYRARFWIDDFAKDSSARDEVRTAIAYEFSRRGIEIPWPIQVEYKRQEAPVDTPARRERFLKIISTVPVLAPLSADAHKALAQAAAERVYGKGEVIVREGEPGGSMFVISQGRVAIAIGDERREVATIDTGGYFGEMSLLTGQPRTATVTARGDCTVLEISADVFGAYVRNHPHVLDQLAAAAAKRQTELDATRAASVKVPVPEAGKLVELMRKFFGLSD